MILKLSPATRNISASRYRPIESELAATGGSKRSAENGSGNAKPAAETRGEVLAGVKAIGKGDVGDGKLGLCAKLLRGPVKAALV